MPLPLLAAAAIPMLMQAGKSFMGKAIEGDRNDVNRQEEEARLKARAALSNRFQEQPGGAAPMPPVPPTPAPPPIQQPEGAQQNPVMGAVGGAMQGLMGAAKPDEDNPFLSMARGYLGR